MTDQTVFPMLCNELWRRALLLAADACLVEARCVNSDFVVIIDNDLGLKTRLRGVEPVDLFDLWTHTGAHESRAYRNSVARVPSAFLSCALRAPRKRGQLDVFRLLVALHLTTYKTRACK